jgi:hypothetical protein
MGSPMLVMRKGIGLLAMTAAATLLAPGSAAAKGSTLRFQEERYAPGNRAVAHALVETWLALGARRTLRTPCISSAIRLHVDRVGLVQHELREHVATAIACLRAGDGG